MLPIPAPGWCGETNDSGVKEFILIFLFAFISYNVLSMRRSSSPYKKKPQVFWWAGMWVRENRTKRSDCGFSNPEGANSF